MNDDLELKKIGQRLRDARVKKKLSQADVAFDAGINVSHISDIENGKKAMSVLTFSKIISCLKVSADEILRPDVPTVNSIYQKELANLLSDCTPAEMEAILKIAQEVKASLHSKKDDD